MKRIGIVLIILYLLLALSLLFPSLEQVGAIGLIIYLPIILILASANILNDHSYKGRKFLVILSITSIILLTLSKVGVQLIPGFWRYADWIYYISIFLFLGASGLVLINAITSKTSIRITTDSIILLIPLTAFFLLEHAHFNDYIHKSNVERIDFLIRELDETNRLMAQENGAEYQYGLWLKGTDSLKYGHLIKIIDSTFYKVAEYSGGFKEGYTNVLFNPHKTRYPDMALRETQLLDIIRSELNQAIESEHNHLHQSELKNLLTDIFAKSAHENTVVEFRLRCAIARNKLLWLEKIKKEP